MITYTLQNVQQSPSYDALKRNGFTNEEVINYYKLDPSQRGAYFMSIKNGLTAKVETPQPKEAVEIRGTQKCTTEVTLANIKRMALEYMDKDFEYNGRTYNMNQLGWKFAFSNKKRALGTCRSSRISRVGTIYLSQWIIENSQESYDKWVNTMLHEIAHAIDVTIRGRSSHDWQWKHIARSIGCDGERTTSVEYADLLANPISKYTMVCPNGHTTPSHKRRASHTRQSCGQCSSRFDERYLLKQIQNW